MPFQKGHVPATAFKKGQSGNPAGRPPRTISEYELRRLAQAEGPACIDALVRIRDDAKSPPSTVITACVQLLDRGFGRPPQVDAQPVPDQAAPSGVVETPRPFSTTAEWQQSASAWVEKQRQAQGPPHLQAQGNGTDPKRH